MFPVLFHISRRPGGMKNDRKGEYIMTSTDICNLALSYLSKGKITSMEDNTEEAAQCKLHYEHNRRLLLRQYPWGFARRTVKLALLDAKVPGYDFVYAYPPECMAVRYVFDEDNAAAREDDLCMFDTVITSGNQKAIATNVELAWCEYTFNVRDVDMFPDEFVEAFAHYLAANMAMVLTGSASIQQTQFQLYQESIEMAKIYSAQERRKNTVYHEGYAEARFS